MGKTTGLGDNFYVAGYNLSGDINSLKKISGSLATLDVTDITQSAYERLGGLRDGAIDFTSYFDPATGMAHDALSALPTTDVMATYLQGTTLGNPAAVLIGKQVDYSPKRGTDGSLLFDVSAVANSYGLDWGINLTAGVRDDTAATAGATVDQTTVSTSFGWQAYLQVFAVTGTSVTVTLEDSANGTDWTALASGAFAAATPAASPQTQRLVGGATDTVRRYIRATSSGTFSDAQFAVVFVRNLNLSVVF
jgi:hypothetical protein